MTTLLLFLVVLVVLIVVHECGHFVAARLAKMHVDEFGLGYPPRALTLGKIRETEYTLNWIPFGGFVKIKGEDEVGKGTSVEPDSFTARPRFAQALVLVAGVAMNLVLAWILFSITLLAPHRISDHEIAGGLSLVNAFLQGAEVTYRVTYLTFFGLVDFFASIFTLSANLSQITGPVGIAGAVGVAAETGWQSLLSLTALISVNLALINLLPIPALDGGRLLFVMIEAVTRRPINPVVSGTMHAVSFVFLVLLMFVITAHDVYKLIW